MATRAVTPSQLEKQSRVYRVGLKCSNKNNVPHNLHIGTFLAHSRSGIQAKQPTKTPERACGICCPNVNSVLVVSCPFGVSSHQHVYHRCSVSFSETTSTKLSPFPTIQGCHYHFACLRLPNSPAGPPLNLLSANSSSKLKQTADILYHDDDAALDLHCRRS